MPRTTTTRAFSVGRASQARAEVLRSRSFLTKETAASHTMHEARGSHGLHCAAARCGHLPHNEPRCSLTGALQIVKHFNATEQGVKSYLHRHVRARAGGLLSVCTDSPARHC